MELMFSYFDDPLPVESPICKGWGVNYAVDVDHLPDAGRELEWYEETETRNLISSIFLGLGCLGAGATLLTALLITEVVVATVVAVICALVAVILLGFALAVYLIEASELDPVYRMEHRESFLLAQDTAPPFSSLEESIQNKILHSHEVQSILTQEIQSNTFEGFMLKHEIDGLLFLNEKNLALLRPKWIATLHQFKDEGKEKLDEISKTGVARIFKFDKDELLPLFAPYEWKKIWMERDLLKLDFHAFFKMYGLHAICEFGLENVEKIRPDFIIPLKEHMPNQEEECFQFDDAHEIPTQNEESSPGLLASSWRFLAPMVSPLIPAAVKNVGQCAALGLQLAQQGHLKESAIAFGAAATCVTGMALNAAISAEHPEAVRIAKDLAKFENT